MRLRSVPFTPEAGRVYRIELAAEGTALTLSVDGKVVARARDDRFAHGMSGLRLGAIGRMAVDRFAVTES